MSTKTSSAYKFYKCLAVLYLVFNCILGICIVTFASYLLIFRQGSHVSKPRKIVLCFLTVPGLLIFMSAFLGWSAIKKKNKYLLKLFTVLLSLTIMLLVAGCVWCFISLPQINEQVTALMKHKFFTLTVDNSNEKWWNDIQAKLQCCGLYGPTDYAAANGIPFSCCGSNMEDSTKSSCSYVYQKGCTQGLAREVSQDVICLGLLGLGVAFFQIPGIFILWCFARRMIKQIYIEKLAK